jgi:hypothetical protein
MICGLFISVHPFISKNGNKDILGSSKFFYAPAKKQKRLLYQRKAIDSRTIKLHTDDPLLAMS